MESVLGFAVGAMGVLGAAFFVAVFFLNRNRMEHNDVPIPQEGSIS